MEESLGTELFRSDRCWRDGTHMGNEPGQKKLARREAVWHPLGARHLRLRLGSARCMAWWYVAAQVPSFNVFLFQGLIRGPVPSLSLHLTIRLELHLIVGGQRIQIGAGPGVNYLPQE